MSALDGLLAGFKEFRTRYFEEKPEVYAKLVSRGQRPEVLVIGCCDSRADPAILLSAEPGELFIIRNVANLVPPYEPDSHYHGTSAGLEFAVRDLNVRHILVLGHSGCGGIQALLDPGAALESREFIAQWVAIAGRIRKDMANVSAADPKAAEQAAIRVSLANLMSFPWIAERVKSGALSLHGWWFDLDEGALWGIDEPDGEFKALT